MNMCIGENIKCLRRAKNITQEQLAENLNVSTTAVSKWERNESYPDIALLFPLAYYFGISVDALMGYDSERITNEIQKTLEHHNVLLRAKPDEAQSYITEAYRKYPNDYRIMYQYMRGIAGGYADNNPDDLLAHKDELRAICDRLDGFLDLQIRLDAYNMRAKILHAEGKTDEALAVYREHFPDWYATWEQKSEQLFAKDTEGFRMQLTDNMIELADFAANKKLKEIWYCLSYTLEKKAEKGLEFAKHIAHFREASGYSELCLVEYHILSDHAWKMGVFGVAPDDIAPVLEMLFEAAHRLDTVLAENNLLQKLLGKTDGRSYVYGIIKNYEESEFQCHYALLKNPACRVVFDKWRTEG